MIVLIISTYIRKSHLELDFLRVGLEGGMEIGWGIEGTLFSPGTKGTLQCECETSARKRM